MDNFGPELLAEDREWGLNESAWLDSQVETESEENLVLASGESTDMKQEESPPSAGQSEVGVTSRQSRFREEFDLPSLKVPFGESIDDFFARVRDRPWEAGETLGSEEMWQRRSMWFQRLRSEGENGVAGKGSADVQEPKKSTTKTEGRKKRILAWIQGLMLETKAGQPDQGGGSRRESCQNGSGQEAVWWQQAMR